MQTAHRYSSRVLRDQVDLLALVQEEAQDSPQEH